MAIIPSCAQATRRAVPRVVVLVAVALLATSCNLLRPSPTTSLPLPLEDLIPKSWRVYTVPDTKTQLYEINIDGDIDTEWLVFFYYDNVKDGANGPLGGIIYDAQQDTTPYDPQTIIPLPYQPSAFLVPYRLLPDWRQGKGQGYLGESSLSFEQTSTNPAPNDEDTIYDELLVLGNNRGDILTRASIFWWQGVPNGYGVAHFAGTYGINLGDRAPGTTVSTVRVLDSLNERAYLCKSTQYARMAGTRNFGVTAQPSIVFCHGGTPEAPTYPEAVVLTWLLDPGRTDLIAPNRVDAIRAVSPQGVQRVVSITYDSTAGSAGLGNNAVSKIEVVTSLVDAAGIQRTYRWTLVERKPQAVGETSRWLIEDMVLLQ